MTISDQWRANAGVIHLVVCILAIIIGVLMYVNAFHVGVDHKAAGVIEVTLGVLGLV